ncbi:hypothetical protein P3W53_15775 [Pseudomonas denitrificans (nom. rej.)]|nr:hypothetical protein [Pseudomonas denitrificans (nom. rej.)]
MFESLRDLFDSFRDEFRRSRGETKPLPLPPKPPAAPRPTQPVPSRPNLPPAGPVDSALAPLKSWAHPLGDESDPLVQLTNLARAVGGYYPLGRNGFWHGGVHFDAGTAGIVGIDQPNVHCLADGEVAAYRIDSRYPFNTYYLEDQSPCESVFSTGFVLVRHRLQAPAIEGSEGAPPALTFYSLYLHLQSWEEYENNPAQARPAFWKAGTYRVKADVSDPGPLGLPVHKKAQAQSDVLAVLPRGTRVTINGHQGIVKLTSAQGIDLPRLDAASSTLGYVKLDALEVCEGGYRVRDNAIGQTPGEHLNVLAEASRTSSVIATLPRGTEIVISGEGDYRKLEMIQPGTDDETATTEAGGAFTDEELQADSPPSPPQEKQQWGGTDFSSPKGYVRFSALEPIPAPQQFDRIVIPDPPIPIKAGQLIGHMGNTQNDDGAPPQPLLHLEVFSGDKVETFIKDCRAWAQKLPATSKNWLKLARGTKVITHQDSFKKESPPTLQAEGAESGNDLLIPRSLLDGLRSESIIQVPAKNGANALNWYRLDGLLNSANYTLLDGWVCEEVGVTPWVSPWSWEGFECIYSDTCPRENLAYSMRAENELNEEQLKRYQPLIEWQEKNALQKRLYDLIPDGNCDGKLSARELQDGLRIPAVAQAISQLIIHYESEWNDAPGKWDALDDMFEHSGSTPNFNWVASKERMHMTSWWREVAQSVGLPESGEIYHFHPIGLLKCFVRSSVEILIRKIGDIISHGEGGYESYNTGTKDVSHGRVGFSFLSPPTGTVTEKTISQIIATDSLSGLDRDRMFATGKYQTVITTLRSAKSVLNLSGNEKYDAEMQEMVFREYLLDKAGGGALGAFVKRGKGTIDDAQLAAAKEWASIAAPSGRKISDGRISDGSLSYYGSPANYANQESTRLLREILSSLRPMR